MENKEIVEKYYGLVDQEDIDGLLELFDSEIVYYRDGLVFKGIKEFENFFRNVRDLKGKHEIIEMVSDGDLVMVRGKFKGNKNLEFTDSWYFKKGKVIKRESFIFNS